MKRIMLYMLGFLIYGIILMQTDSVVLRAALFAAPVLVCILLYKKFGFKRIFALLAVTVFGGAVFALNNANGLNPKLAELCEKGGRAVLDARVKDIRKSRGDVEFYVIDVDGVEADSQIIALRKRLLYYPEENEALKVSQRVRLDVKLYKITKNTNPYDFNAYNYYAARGVYFKAYGKALEKGEICRNLNFYLNAVREKLEKTYDEILPEKYAAIAKAIIIGQRWGIDEDTVEVYKTAGIYHILAISGLHISVICGFLVFIADKIHIRYGKLGVIAVLVFYALMTGGSPSVVRAVIMAGVFLFRYIVLKSGDFLSSVAFSCFIVLCIRPMMLFDIGFQYTYCAVFTIGFILNNTLKILNKGRLFNFAASCVIISQTLKAVTAYYFYGVSNIDSLLNFMILPFVGMSVISAFVGGIVGMLWTGGGKLCISVFYVIWVYINKISDILIKLPYSYIIMGRPAVIVLIGFGIFYVLASFGLYEGIHAFLKRKVFIASGLLIFSLCCGIDLAQRHCETLKIDFIDIGQGDGAYGKYRDFTFLIDGGGGALERQNYTARRILTSHIRGSGGNVINAAFVSHTDEDHVNGIIEIMGIIKIEGIYVSAANNDDESYRRLISKAEENSIPVYKMKRGDYVSYNRLKISALYPFDDENTGLDNNNSSLVLKVEKDDADILFTGDLEKEGEDAVLKSGEDISCDIIKIAHHGSDTSSQKEFIDKTGAGAAVISVGRNNSYNHPSSEVVKRIEDSGIKLYTTAENGNVHMETDGKTIRIKAMY